MSSEYEIVVDMPVAQLKSGVFVKVKLVGVDSDEVISEGEVEVIRVMGTDQIKYVWMREYDDLGEQKTFKVKFDQSRLDAHKRVLGSTTLKDEPVAPDDKAMRIMDELRDLVRSGAVSSREVAQRVFSGEDLEQLLLSLVPERKVKVGRVSTLRKHVSHDGVKDTDNDQGPGTGSR